MGRHWRMNGGIAAVLLAIVALSPMPSGSNRAMFWMMSATVVFITAAVFLASIAQQNRQFPVPLRRIWLLSVLVIAYLLFMGLGVLPSATPKASFLATLRTLSYATFFFLVLQVAANPKRASWMLKALLFTLAFYALIGFLARFGVFRFPEILIPASPQQNATATFINRNSYATFLGFGLLIGISLITRRIRSGRRRSLADPRLLLLMAAVLVILVTLIATNSRMGVAAVLFALVIFLLILLAKRNKLGAPAVLGASVIIAAVMFGAFYLYGGVLLDRLGSVERDVDVRFALYQQVWDMIMARPWMGYGADSFELAFQKFHALPVSPDRVWDKAHNSTLTNWAETGLVFGSIPMVLLALVFVVFTRAVLRRQRGFILPLLGMSVILQGAMHSMVDFSLEIQANVYLLLAIVAIALADALRAGSQ